MEEIVNGFRIMNIEKKKSSNAYIKTIIVEELKEIKGLSKITDFNILREDGSHLMISVIYETKKKGK